MTPTPEWAAEVELDEAAVRAILAEQFPRLHLDGLALLATGWDNALWTTGEGIAFRFPRRAIALPGIERELRILPALAHRLPLPIPRPEWIGVPSARFPWPFFGARLLPGREPAEVGLDGRREAFGADLGAFLRVLHAPAIVAAFGTGLPRDPMGRADMSARVPRTRERLAALADAGLWTPSAAAEQVLDAAHALGPATGNALVHGDLHVRHVLVDGDGRPSAVIDWGDLCAGDPSIDLALYWSVLDGGGRAAFRAAYGESELPTERLLRARVLALFLSAALASYAHDVGNTSLLRETIQGLERAVAG